MVKIYFKIKANLRVSLAKGCTAKLPLPAVVLANLTVQDEDL